MSDDEAPDLDPPPDLSARPPSPNLKAWHKTRRRHAQKTMVENAAKRAELERQYPNPRPRGRPPVPPACHPERPQVGKTGLCYECYVGGREALKEMGLSEVVALIKKDGSGMDPAALAMVKRQALALLISRLPEYAQIHYEAAKMAALKGNAQPAEWALTTIRELGGAPVVEEVQKATAAGDGGVKVFVGVKLSGGSEASDTVEASLVPTGRTR